MTDAARAIRPYLAELLDYQPPLADHMDSELARLLNRADGSVSDARIGHVLASNPITEMWAAQFLDFGMPPDFLEPADRGPGMPSPGGDGEPVRPGPKFVCPAGGDVVWWRRHVGQDVPRCPTHGVLLARA